MAHAFFIAAILFFILLSIVFYFFGTEVGSMINAVIITATVLFMTRKKEVRENLSEIGWYVTLLLASSGVVLCCGVRSCDELLSLMAKVIAALCVVGILATLLIKDPKIPK